MFEPTALGRINIDFRIDACSLLLNQSITVRRHSEAEILQPRRPFFTIINVPREQNPGKDETHDDLHAKSGTSLVLYIHYSS